MKIVDLLKKKREEFIWRRQGIERVMEIRPPYRLISKDPKKNYGIGGVRLVFILKGRHGAVTFQMLTQLYCFDDKEGWKYAKERIGEATFEPYLPVGIDVHSMKQHHEDQISCECDWVPGGVCYVGGSGMAGRPLLERWAKSDIQTSNDVVWEELERWYRAYFLD